MNAKSKFRAIGRGAVKSEKFTNLLAKMTSEAEENKRKKRNCRTSTSESIKFQVEKQ